VRSPLLVLSLCFTLFCCYCPLLYLNTFQSLFICFRLQFITFYANSSFISVFNEKFRWPLPCFRTTQSYTLSMFIVQTWRAASFIRPCFNISQVPIFLPAKLYFPSGTAFITDVSFFTRFMLSVSFFSACHPLMLSVTLITLRHQVGTPTGSSVPYFVSPFNC
jgi:hypothetical protein